MESREIERGIGYWRRLIEANPYSWKGHGFLAQTLALSERWAAAVDECRSALQLNPFEVPTRMLLIDCLIRLGQKEQARAEFDALVALRPPDSDGLRRWFDELLGGK
jgi:Flp pilus assembly protein TadD